jgi:hypothetical protein
MIWQNVEWCIGTDVSGKLDASIFNVVLVYLEYGGSKVSRNFGIELP